MNLISESQPKEFKGQKKFKPYKNHHINNKNNKKNYGPKPNIKKALKCYFVRKTAMQNLSLFFTFVFVLYNESWLENKSKSEEVK